MKKLLLIASLILAMTGMSFAQAQKPARTKKDGTADMRYKANKDSAARARPAGPTKKDGTPDMRYKANKPKKS